jgi:flagellar biosynthetic protein FliQ
MTQDTVVSICTSAMEVGLVLGLIVSVFQAVTQIQEQTLTFIPKIIGLAVVLMVAGPWMLGEIVSWTQELYGRIPELVG